MRAILVLSGVGHLQETFALEKAETANVSLGRDSEFLKARLNWTGSALLQSLYAGMCLTEGGVGRTKVSESQCRIDIEGHAHQGMPRTATEPLLHKA